MDYDDGNFGVDAVGIVVGPRVLVERSREDAPHIRECSVGIYISDFRRTIYLEVLD